MAELKTRKTNANVTKFLNSGENEQRRNDGLELLKVFKEVTKLPAKMWGQQHRRLWRVSLQIRAKQPGGRLAAYRFFATEEEHDCLHHAGIQELSGFDLQARKA
jgi:hypothetical protein